MTWEKAEDLAITLLGNGRSEGEVIKKLCEVTDRHRYRAKEYSDKLSDVKDQLIQLKKVCGRIIQIEVEMIQRYDFRKVVWYKSRPYEYSTKGIWTPINRIKVSERWPDATQYGKFKVWIELDQRDRDVICKGVTMGFIKGMTCIELDSETQSKMHLNHGDEVTVTKVRKHFKG